MSLPSPGEKLASASIKELALPIHIRPPSYTCAVIACILYSDSATTQCSCVDQKLCQKTGWGVCDKASPFSQNVEAHGLRQAYLTYPASQPHSVRPGHCHTQQEHGDSLHLTCSNQHSHFASHSATLHPCQGSHSFFQPSSHAWTMAIGTFPLEAENW